ncbi:hypothetical protein DSAG12_00298 [Promethearchaeum syntrophicum]|uniref:Uncharacterized protein n=1 Tax=Promethearchaeum syntrophicum TaxID=2594042 RepID=A0A5B9D655_9ARCH|nr:hypothetical protein [Candidatus Prometheoarchaeum syntrophicum]QEE14485.1 hypothetical protein DSAG12_00298 [Candidatus Prometheoarchaeum syntrophicum]
MEKTTTVQEKIEVERTKRLEVLLNLLRSEKDHSYSNFYKLLDLMGNEYIVNTARRPHREILFTKFSDLIWKLVQIRVFKLHFSNIFIPNIGYGEFLARIDTDAIIFATEENEYLRSIVKILNPGINLIDIYKVRGKKSTLIPEIRTLLDFSKKENIVNPEQKKEKDQRFDLIFYNIISEPYIKSPRKRNDFFLKLLKLLKDNGSMIALVGKSFLVGYRFTQTRKQILEGYCIEQIVNLPYGSIEGVHQRFELILIEIKKKSSKPSIKMINLRNFDEKSNNVDLENQNSIEITLNDIFKHPQYRLDWNYYSPKYRVLSNAILSLNYKNLGEFAKIFQGIHRMNISEILSNSGEIMVVGPRNFLEGRIQPFNERRRNREIVQKYIKMENVEKIKNFQLKPGDILVPAIHSINNLTLKTYIVSKEDPLCIASENIIVIRSLQFPSYLNLIFFNTEAGKRIFTTLVNKTMRGLHISIDDLKSLQIPILDQSSLEDLSDNSVPVYLRYRKMLMIYMDSLRQKSWECKSDLILDTEIIDIALFQNEELISFIFIRDKFLDLKEIHQKYVDLCKDHKIKKAFLITGENLYCFSGGQFLVINEIPDFTSFIQDLDSKQNESSDSDRSKLDFSLFMAEFYQDFSMNCIAMLKEKIKFWDYLTDFSKDVLPQAEQQYESYKYTKYTMYNGVIDNYCKSFEREAKSKIFLPFIEYLNIHLEDIDNFLSDEINLKFDKTYKFAKEIQSLRTNSGTRLKITLGDMNNYLNFAGGKKTLKKSPLIQHFKQFLLEEFSSMIFKDKDFVNSFKEIAIRFRNPSAHGEDMDEIAADECREILPPRIDELLGYKYKGKE